MNKTRDKIYENLCNKISDNSRVPDSEIILIIECAKRKDPSFDINWVDYGGNCWTLLIHAVYWEREELVEYILTYPNINVNHKSYDDYTAFYYACLYCIITSFKSFLCRRDININIQNQRGRTGLHCVCMYNYIEYVRELLLDARIDIMIHDVEGKTALDYAIEEGHLGIANILKRTEYTSLLRIPNNALLYDITRMIIEEYT